MAREYKKVMNKKPPGSMRRQDSRSEDYRNCYLIFWPRQQDAMEDKTMESKYGMTLTHVLSRKKKYSMKNCSTFLLSVVLVVNLFLKNPHQFAIREQRAERATEEQQ